MVPAQGLAVVLAAFPGLVELLANRPAALHPAGALPVSGFVALRGAALPPMAADEAELRKPLDVEAAFAVRTADPARLTAVVEWGDGSRSPAAVQLDRAAPGWLQLPGPLAGLTAPHSVYGRLVASHAYAAADLYTVRVTLNVTREADGATSSFTRTHRLRVRDPGVAVQPWRFDLESITVTCGDDQACDFPAPLGTRVNAEAAFLFGPSWLSAHTARWDWGDGTSGDAAVGGRGGVGRATGSHTYAKGGRFKVTLTLNGRHKDGTPEARTQTFQVAVSDIGIDDVSGPPPPVAAGYPAEFQAAFRYTDAKRTRRATWTWGDGQSSPGEISERAGTGTVFGRHRYPAGVHEVTLTITDGQDATRARTEVTVTSPGSVTAAGVLPCPAGVIRTDPRRSGQAQLSLAARHDGAAASGGFRLSAPGLEFLSESIESLAITKTEARAAGTGSVNGQRPFLFTVDVWIAPAAEGRPETQLARVRIHDVARQEAVFDNDVFDGALQPLVGARMSFVTD